MAWLQRADRDGRIDSLARPHGRAYRFIAGAQAAGMCQRDDVAARQNPGEHHGCRSRGVDDLIDRPG